jgi:hypothetical protein
LREHMVISCFLIWYFAAPMFGTRVGERDTFVAMLEQPL